MFDITGCVICDDIKNLLVQLALHEGLHDTIQEIQEDNDIDFGLRKDIRDDERDLNEYKEEFTETEIQIVNNFMFSMYDKISIHKVGEGELKNLKNYFLIS